MDYPRKFKFRLDRLRWLSSKTAFVTTIGIDDGGDVIQYLVHWGWPLSGQKCRINGKTGEIIEFAKQDAFGIKIYQATTEQSLEMDFGSTIKERLKNIKDHVCSLTDDATPPTDQDDLL